jgi:ankyrin repeat protein
MFRALLCQLYRQSLSARRTILVAFNAKKENHSSEEGGNAVWTLEELQTLFSEIVLSEQMGENEVIILIDALDEAMDEGSKAATKLLEFFHRLIEAVVAKRRKTKVCISCREYPVVAVSGGSLQISIQDSNRQDIERFVSYQLRIGVEGWELQPEKVRTDLENAIVQKADGVFLWVAKRMQRIVEELNDGSSSFADVQRLVERESNELYVMYEDILSREVKQSARQKAKLFLGWVCLAERPLSLTEIRIAMACDAGCIVDGQERIEESKEFVEEDTRMQRLVKSLSGGLAEVRLCTDGTTVQLIHQTVSEFLCEGGLRTLFTDTRDSKALSLSDAEVIGRYENALSRACFNYLRLGEIASFSMTYGTLPVPTVCQVEERFPFIRYAVMFCFLHAQRAEFLGISQDDLPAIVDHSTEAAIFDIPESNEIRVSHHPPSIFETWKVMFEAVRRLYEQPLVPGLQLIHTAAYCNLQSTVRYLVEKRGQIEVKNRVQETALHHAVRGGHEDLVRWLLDSGADIESENISLSTPLELAIKNRHDHIIKLLLERGADANKQTGSFSNMLEAACNAKGRVELIEHLIDCGAEVNGLGGAVVKRGTALEEAAHAGDEEAVRLLIAKGANVHAMSEYYGGALQAAVQGLKGPRSYAKAVVELLLQERVDINAQGGEYGNALQAAAKYSSLDVIELLLDSGADVNAQGGYYGNALQAACDNINVGDGEEAVQMLLSRGADVNARGGYYGSAIQSAAFSGNSNTFRTLFERGARIDIKGGIHQNMIEAAGAGGNREIFQLLLDNGADINEQGGTYGTALQAAVFYSSGNFVEFLLDNGADLNLQGGFFGNALCATVEGGRGEKMVEILLKRGADVHACAPGHLSALQMVLKKGNAKQMKLLLEHGNDINAQMSGMLRFFRA